MICPTCGHDAPEPYDAAAEGKRIAALAAAAKCRPEDVNPALIWAHGLDLRDVLDGVEGAKKISGAECVAAKAAHDELAAAHLATFGEPCPADKAIAVAQRVRAEPAKAPLLVAQAMADAVDVALVKAEAVAESAKAKP
jgi:hypothetical protein